MYFTYRDENRSLEQIGLWSSGGASVTGVAEPEMPRALFVTYGVLDTVGVKRLLGRWFSQKDDAPGSAETVMLTYGYWQRRFGGDTSVVGRTLTIDSKPRTVIGVMPREFRFSRDPELILPQRFERNTQFLGGFGHQGIARLKPGVTIAQANADVARMLGVWLNAWPPNPGLDRTVFQGARFGPALQPLKQDVIGDSGTALWVVMGTLGLVLLIACANVANLLLARAESRQQGARDPRRAGRRLRTNRPGNARRKHHAGSAGRRVGSQPGICSLADPGRERAEHLAATADRLGLPSDVRGTLAFG
jgi:hypothetical protein